MSTVDSGRFWCDSCQSVPFFVERGYPIPLAHPNTALNKRWKDVFPMKKFALLLLSLTLCFALAACGGSDTSADEQAAADDTAASTTADESADTSATSDKQTAIDEFNATSAAFNEVANAINADPSAFDSDVIDTMQKMSDLINKYQNMLTGDD